MGGGGRHKRRRISGGLQQNFLMGGSITDPLNLTALEPRSVEESGNNVLTQVSYGSVAVKLIVYYFRQLAS